MSVGGPIWRVRDAEGNIRPATAEDMPVIEKACIEAARVAELRTIMARAALAKDVLDGKYDLLILGLCTLDYSVQDEGEDEL